MASEEITYQTKLGRTYHRQLRGRMKKLRVKISGRRNAVYNKDDVQKVLLSMSDTRRSAASASRRLAVEDAGHHGNRAVRGSRRTPSPSWVLKKLRVTDRGDAQRWCDTTTRKLASTAKSKGLVGRGCTVGIDVTNIPYYGRTLKEDMMKTKPKNGTSRFLSFMAVHSVGDGLDVFVAADRITNEDKTHDAASRILKRLVREGLRPYWVLADRGFYQSTQVSPLGGLAGWRPTP